MKKISTLRSVTNDYFKHSKSTKGITLVALIITIIVLLILVGISISLVLGEDGILNHSHKAVKATEDEMMKEEIATAYSAWKMAKISGESIDDSQFIKNEIGNDKVESVTISNGILNVKLINGKEYLYNTVTGKFENIIPWNELDNGTYSRGEGEHKTTIKMGDYVDYDPMREHNGSTTYTSLPEKTGVSYNQEFNAQNYTNANYGWRVLDVENGKIRLIADKCIGPGDGNSSYALQGEKGYLNAIQELNDICSIFGKGKGAQYAKSIDANDVCKITGYNPNSPKFREGEWEEYGTEVTYTYNSESNKIISTRTNAPEGGTSSYDGITSRFHYYDENTNSFKDLTSGSVKLKNSYFSKKYYNFVTQEDMLDSEGIFKTNYEIILGKYKFDANNNYSRSLVEGTDPVYWLASNYIWASDDCTGYGVHGVGKCMLGYGFMFYSDGDENNTTCKVRPVVTLLPNVNLTWNEATNKWNIE